MRAVESFVEERRSETARTRMVTGARETRIAHKHGNRNEREDRFEDRDIGLVRDCRGRETGYSCFIGPSRPTLATRRWRRWQRWNRVYEEEAKNEDEVNDIHGGYRILPARSHLWLPCLLPSLLRLSFLHFASVLLAPPFPFRKLRMLLSLLTGEQRYIRVPVALSVLYVPRLYD